MTIMNNIKPYQAAILTGVGYYLTAVFAIRFTIMPEGIAIMWPPNAILLAALLLSPHKNWWLFLIAAAIAEFAADLGSFPVWQIFGFIAVNLFEGLFSAFLIEKLTRSHPLQLTLKNLVTTIGVILFTAPPIAALAGAKIYALGDPSVEYWEFWRLWWFGDVTGIIVTLPFILALSEKEKFLIPPEGLSANIAASLTMAMIITGLLLFSDLSNYISPVVIMIFVVWIALKTSIIITTSAGLIISLLITVSTTSGTGPFLQHINETNIVLAAQEYLIALSLLGLFLSHTITELRIANEEFKIINKKLVKAQKVKAEILANFSHELKTPVHAISNFANIIKKRSEDKKTLLFLEKIQLSSARLTKLIDNLLDLSLLKNREMLIKISENDLTLITQQEVKEVADMAKQKSIELQVISRQHYAVEIDAELIRKVIANLLSNAIKYSPEHSTIKINIAKQSYNQTLCEDNMLYVAVIDQGVGIPENELENIFESFSESSRTSTGAGAVCYSLSLAKSIIQAHKGKIWAESPADDNTGSIFQFAIPIKTT